MLCYHSFKLFAITKEGKVQLFWGGHKNVRNCPYGLESYLVNVKSMRTIAQIFVASSDKLNFIQIM